jgi:hypothetical protein
MWSVRSKRARGLPLLGIVAERGTSELIRLVAQKQDAFYFTFSNGVANEPSVRDRRRASFLDLAETRNVSMARVGELCKHKRPHKTPS